ncbi:hypothetical protein FB451DRAFT_1273042 [Mycena latifolia]|nr:hypothetical protein FB451DRAFT_1273042 [Mycena latifolia]
MCGRRRGAHSRRRLCTRCASAAFGRKQGVPARVEFRSLSLGRADSNNDDGCRTGRRSRRPNTEKGTKRTKRTNKKTHTMTGMCVCPPPTSSLISGLILRTHELGWMEKQTWAWTWTWTAIRCPRRIPIPIPTMAKPRARCGRRPHLSLRRGALRWIFSLSLSLDSCFDANT